MLNVFNTTFTFRWADAGDELVVVWQELPSVIEVNATGLLVNVTAIPGNYTDRMVLAVTDGLLMVRLALRRLRFLVTGLFVHYDCCVPV